MIGTIIFGGLCVAGGYVWHMVHAEKPKKTLDDDI